MPDPWKEDNYWLDKWVENVLDPKNDLVSPLRKRRRKKRGLRLDVPASEHYQKVAPGSPKVWWVWPGEVLHD